MMKFLQKLIGTPLKDVLYDELIKIEKTLDEYYNSILSKKIENPDIRLMRAILGSSNLENVERIDQMSESDRSSYVAAVAESYDVVFKPVLKQLIEDQRDFISNEAQDMYQVAFARGTLNGAKLLDEKLLQYKGEHLQHMEELKERSGSS